MVTSSGVLATCAGCLDSEFSVLISARETENRKPVSVVFECSAASLSHPSGKSLFHFAQFTEHRTAPHASQALISIHSVPTIYSSQRLIDIWLHQYHFTSLFIISTPLFAPPVVVKQNLAQRLKCIICFVTCLDRPVLIDLTANFIQ